MTSWFVRRHMRPRRAHMPRMEVLSVIGRLMEVLTSQSLVRAPLAGFRLLPKTL
jgi:hypothetical protein